MANESRATQVTRQDLSVLDSDIRITRVFMEALVQDDTRRVTRLYAEVVSLRPTPPVAKAAITPIFFTSNG